MSREERLNELKLKSEVLDRTIEKEQVKHEEEIRQLEEDLVEWSEMYFLLNQKKDLRKGTGCTNKFYNDSNNSNNMTSLSSK
ncbi:21955_t:CDS:2, partial [Dentiscutata erythropus]